MLHINLYDLCAVQYLLICLCDFAEKGGAVSFMAPDDMSNVMSSTRIGTPSKKLDLTSTTRVIKSELTLNSTLNQSGMECDI